MHTTTFLLGSSGLLRAVRSVLHRANLYTKTILTTTTIRSASAEYLFGLTYLGSFTFKAFPSLVIKILGGFTFFFFSLKVGGGWGQGAMGKERNKQRECKRNIFVKQFKKHWSGIWEYINNSLLWSPLFECYAGTWQIKPDFCMICI